MVADVVLTVSESKRLIAKGVAELPEVRHALHSGLVVIATGSTNAYVVEEIMGKKIEKPRYRSGLTLPAKGDARSRLPKDLLPDVVLRRGEPVPDLDRFTAAPHLREGDVYIKGCNALNYDKRVAGILVGASDGGTIGNALGHIVGRRAHLVIPVGLEKVIETDIIEASLRISRHGPESKGVPRLLPVTGLIVTEIEALRLLTGVEATWIASGGVGGAEGSVRLLLEGNPDQMQKALQLVESIQGEPPYIEC